MALRMLDGIWAAVGPTNNFLTEKRFDKPSGVRDWVRSDYPRKRQLSAQCMASRRASLITSSESAPAALDGAGDDQ